MARTPISLWAGSLMVAALGAYGLWSAATPAPASAQGGAAVDPVLYEQISGLGTRIAQLENQWRQRSTLPAPFRVVDPGGELARIERSAASGLPELQVGPAIFLGYIEGGPAVRVVNGSQQAGLRIEGQTTRIFAATGADGFVAESSPNGQHLASIYVGGNEVANLGTMEGRRAAVRIYEGSTVVAALGIDSSGIGQLRATNPDGSSGVTAGGDGHGGGFVAVWKAKEVASMRTPTGGGTLAVFNNGGTPVGFVTTTSEGAGLVTVNDAAGTEVVHFTVRGTGGSFCSRMRNGNAQCLLPLPR